MLTARSRDLDKTAGAGHVANVARPLGGMVGGPQLIEWIERIPTYRVATTKAR